LNKHDVEYIIVGGDALAFHGKPRHTGDLDIWIDISEENAKWMLKVIDDFGLQSPGCTVCKDSQSTKRAILLSFAI